MDKNFVWGVATAATQIEGGAFEGNKGLTIWDVFPTIENNVFNDHDVKIACDHYHKWKEDVQLIKELGVQAYRFSINWARILPNGVGEVNQEGIRFYSGLIDELLKNNIQPFVTLFHWDLPYEIYKKGGWLNGEIVDWFGEYVKIVAENFAGRVKQFITFNEPLCILKGLGGTVIEGKYSVKDKLQMVHNLLLCHGTATKILREYGVQVGIAISSNISIPCTNSPEDIEAARRHYFKIDKGSTRCVSLYSDPIILGDYPQEYYQVHDSFDLPKITREDLKLISTPIDFYCHNIYKGIRVKANGDGYQTEKFSVGTPMTSMNWFVDPNCLYWGAKFLYERYKKPFYITENGCAVTDILSKDGKIHDGARIEYLKQHIDAYLKAKDEGVDARGYFVWSLMDNFEWTEGYSKRFGLVYVDYETQKRIPKDSYYFYQQRIKE